MNDILFEDSMDSQKIDEKLELESDLIRRKTVDLGWAVTEEDNSIEDDLPIDEDKADDKLSDIENKQTFQK